MVLTGDPLIRVMQLIKTKRPIAFEPSPNFAVALRGFEQQVMQEIKPRLNELYNGPVDEA
jgi:hypothetical protein